MSWFPAVTDRLRQGLGRSQGLLRDGLRSLLAMREPLDEHLLDQLEDLLLGADLGVAVARGFRDRLAQEAKRDPASGLEEAKRTLRLLLLEALEAAGQPLDLDHTPTVLFVLGVNGSGKTTTCGKLAAALRASGKRVLLAAGDTFRAAGIEQLQTWGSRVGVEVISQAAGADPAAVVFDALKAATTRGVDALIVDTAGRLHTKRPLMEE
ncbi:MAG: signal recognition particle receptor subunit alpha, partial [Candidatus Methylomirabilia bacterium]